MPVKVTVELHLDIPQDEGPGYRDSLLDHIGETHDDDETILLMEGRAEADTDAHARIIAMLREMAGDEPNTIGGYGQDWFRWKALKDAIDNTQHDWHHRALRR